MLLSSGWFEIFMTLSYIMLLTIQKWAMTLYL